MSALDWHTSGTIFVCILCVFQQFLYLKIRIFNFLKNILFGFHSHFGECKFSCCVGFHLKEESNNTELAGTFEHSLVCLHDASVVLPGQKWEQSGLLSVSSSNEELLLPPKSCPSFPHVHPCSPLGWCWQIWSSPPDAS